MKIRNLVSCGFGVPFGLSLIQRNAVGFRVAGNICGRAFDELRQIVHESVAIRHLPLVLPALGVLLTLAFRRDFRGRLHLLGCGLFLSCHEFLLL